MAKKRSAKKKFDVKLNRYIVASAIVWVLFLLHFLRYWIINQNNVYSVAEISRSYMLVEACLAALFVISLSVGVIGLLAKRSRLDLVVSLVTIAISVWVLSDFLQWTDQVVAYWTGCHF